MRGRSDRGHERGERSLVPDEASTSARCQARLMAMAAAIDAIVTQQPASKTYRVMTAVSYPGSTAWVVV